MVADRLEIDARPDPFPGLDFPYTRKFKRRLYHPPSFLTPSERQTDRRLRLHTSRYVKPYLHSQKALTALHNYVFDATLYKKFCAYASDPKKSPKPAGFDLCQRALTSPGIRCGAPQDLVLYRGIDKKQMDTSFYNWTPENEKEDDVWLMNRNISTSISPISALEFLKDGGSPKCCMLIFHIPKGFPYMYMPALFPAALTEKEREVLLPSGEYYVAEEGRTVRLDYKKLGIKKGSAASSVRVFVFRPYRRYSPFIAGPKTVYPVKDKVEVLYSLTPKGEAMAKALQKKNAKEDHKYALTSKGEALAAAILKAKSASKNKTKISTALLKKPAVGTKVKKKTVAVKTKKKSQKKK